MKRLVFVYLGLVLVVSERHPVPPPPRHHGYHRMLNMVMSNDMDEVLRDFDEWSPSDPQNIWELSGLFEGDIMLDEEEEQERNGLRGHSRKWSGGVVPYHISSDFDEDEAQVIMGAMDEFHEVSCIKFRPYREGDSSWVTIRGDSPGCWSYVGRRGGGQVVNLGKRCVQHGVAAHELLHALGFHHQQSASDRDKYVKIHWENIRRGTQRNFKKYSSGKITDFNVGYDYDSVMHYSTHAFSKNGNPTITPKDEDATIGQRSRLSEKDVVKLKRMYHCSSAPSPGGGGGGGTSEETDETPNSPTSSFWSQLFS